ncbi:MAG: hypothetical protein ACOCS6_01360, partial [Desulfosalsimonas sp.]
MVLLVPCTDWFITFAHLGGGDAKSRKFNDTARAGKDGASSALPEICAALEMPDFEDKFASKSGIIWFNGYSAWVKSNSMLSVVKPSVTVAGLPSEVLPSLVVAATVYSVPSVLPGT